MLITRLAIEKYQLTILLTISMLITGVITFYNMPRSADPAFPIRVDTVTTQWAGASPNRVEQLITKKLEEEVRKIPEVKEIKSLSTTGNSTIHVKIHDRYFNLDNIWQNVRNKAAAAQSHAPDPCRSVIGQVWF